MHDRLCDVKPNIANEWSKLLGMIDYRAAVTLLDTVPWSLSKASHQRTTAFAHNTNNTSVPHTLSTINYEKLSELCSLDFRSNQFQRVINYLSQRTAPLVSLASPSTSALDQSWLVSMFYSCHSVPSTRIAGGTVASSDDKEVNSDYEMADTSDLLLSLWSCFECGKYCTITRLRTPFGNPVQTFETIEKILVNILARALHPPDGYVPYCSDPLYPVFLPRACLGLFGGNIPCDSCCSSWTT
jgi:hypothetical protein